MGISQDGKTRGKFEVIFELLINLMENCVNAEFTDSSKITTESSQNFYDRLTA
jgi:hypothetical protein